MGHFLNFYTHRCSCMSPPCTIPGSSPVCLSVTMLAATYMYLIPVINEMLSKFCYHLLTTSLPDEFLTDKRDSNGFFSTQRVCTVNDSFYKMTDSCNTLTDTLLKFWLSACDFADLAPMVLLHIT